jgi:tetratricopeptide (TPR) repeat protein
MKNAIILFLLIFFSLSCFAQKPVKRIPPSPKTTQTPPKKLGGEKEEFEKAANETNASGRIKALKRFIENFPKSEQKIQALELIAQARVTIADEKFSAGELKDGIELIKEAVKDAPVAPVSDKLFTETLSQLPTKLFWTYKQFDAAAETAKLIEEKIGDNAKQILELATFYLGTENSSEAKRLAQKAVALEPNSAAAYQLLGLSNRMNFELDESVAAYTKASELDPESTQVKRSLAEMKRAVGKSEEAATLYREILAKDSSDAAAQSGLILSLFDAEKKQDAEAEMAKALEANPKNLLLLVGAAYSYAAHNDGAKAVELAQKAIAVEPRYVWAYVALGRGFLAQKRPLDAEHALLSAKRYGNFPTLDYEIAAARMQAGFFREAAEALQKSFSLKDGNVKAWIGNRVALEAKSFIELLAVERRASIFAPLAADNPESAEKLKSLLALAQKLDSTDTAASETEIVEAAEKFTLGDDEMKPYRQLFAAASLMQQKKALPKILELTQAVVRKVDTALDVPNASAAIMADELYENRTLAITRGEYIVVPNLPRPTLSKILRGRIEEITGWTLYQQNNSAEAVIRLRRALSVLPEKSAWWRSSMWRLGAALEADGRSAEALDAYIKSYTSADAPDAAKRIIIEALYQKINGNTDGLDQKIGAKPTVAVAAPTTIFTSRQQQQQQTETVAQVTEKSAVDSKTQATTETKREAKTDATPNASLSPTTAAAEENPKEEKSKSDTETKTAEVTDNTTVEAKPTPKISPTVFQTQTKTEETKPEKIKPTEEPKPSPQSSPTPDEAKVDPTSTTAVVVVVEDKAKVEPSPSPANEVKNENVEVKTETKSEKTVETKSNPATEIKQTETVQNTNVETKITDTKNKEATTTPKPLFDPIIITIPKPETVKKKDETTDENQAENSSTDETKPKTEGTLTIKKEAVEAIASGEMRERKIEESKAESKEIQPCTIVASQDAVSLLNGGGSLGILVGFQEDAAEQDLKQITAVSSSPKDVEVIQDPDIGANSGRVFFVIKSISPNKGAFTVTFETPCGKKEVLVKVR